MPSVCKTLCSTPNSKKGGIDEEKEDGEVREGEREARRGALGFIIRLAKH